MTPEQPESPEQRALREALQTPVARPPQARPRPDWRGEDAEGLDLDAARGIDDLDGLHKRLDALGSVMVRKFAALEAQIEKATSKVGGLDEDAARELLAQLSTAYQQLLDRQTEILERLSVLDEDLKKPGPPESVVLQLLAEVQVRLTDRQAELADHMQEMKADVRAVRMNLAALLRP